MQPTSSEAGSKVAEFESGKARFWGVLACFFLSGFAALIYQTAWTRQFAFVFGTSELAVATVLAAYMGGLAAGAWFAGRTIARVTRPILVYGLIELGIALSALAVPFGVRAAQSLYLALFGAAGEPPGEGGLVTALFYLACSFVILFPATALMGATLPLLARYAVRSESEIGSRIGALYTANTVGAVAGTTIAGFVLLPRLGLGHTLWTAVAGNALVFCLAALLARNARELPATSKEEARGSANGWILPLIAVSGSVSFLYEVLWTRMLGQILGGSVYAFATMLGTFLTGIALGSWIASRLATTRERSVQGFAWAQLGTAALALAAFKLADSLPAIASSMSTPGLLTDALVCALVLLPSTLCIGATFPFAVRIHARDERDASAGSARVYSWNTVGSIVGAVGAGFFLVPALGYSGSMIAAAGLNLLLAGVAVARSRPVQRLVLAVAGSGLLLLLIFRPEPPWTLLASSPLSGQPAGGELVFFEVGRSSTVQVRERAGSYSLLTNGLQEAIIEPPGASFISSPLGPWMASLPVLVRPDARTMLIVGLGGGGVVEALASTLEHVDVVELEPEVVAANRFLADKRAIDPLADPRAKITTNDARGSLLLTKQRYDAIVSQPSHPWTAGASHLYTREFFELARQRLSDDGVLLQWMGLGFVDEPLLKILVASLLDVYEYVNLIAPIHQGILLIASSQPIDLIESSRRAIAAAPADFESLGVFSAEDVESARVLGTAAARRFAAGAPINTDDLNLLQTRSPAIARKRGSTIDIDQLASDFDPVLLADPQRDDIALVRSLLRRGFPERARRFIDSIEDPATRAHAEALAHSHSRGDNRKSRRLFAEALALDPNSDPLKLAILSDRHLAFVRGVPELDELAASLSGPYAAIAEGWKLMSPKAPDPAALRLLLPALERCEPANPCFLAALRLRASALLASGNADDARSALDLLDRFGALMQLPNDKLLRAQAAVASGAYPAALALAFQIDVRARNNPQAAQLLARDALRMLAAIPQDELGEDGRRLKATFQRASGAQRGF